MAKQSKKGGSGAGGRTPKHSNDAKRSNKAVKGQRDANTVRRLEMYKTRAVRDKKGKILHEDLQSKDLPTTRIQPDRRWFGNTRVIGQKQLEQFREEMSSKINDSYTVLLREKKLPLQLLEDPERKVGGKQKRVDLLSTQPYGETFGPNRKRKRPKLAADGYDDLVQAAAAKEEKFDAKGKDVVLGEFSEFKNAAKDAIFDKGQSKRIWGELYKVLDSSDVVIQVLDARDPEGTRCKFLEQHIRRNARHKHLLLLLNKCDLVPAWVTKRWLHTLSREYPTLAFHASITNPFGKGALLSLLRQLARLRSDKQAISVGFIGYPNVGKSSVINALRTKKVCKTAPVPGETKVWQYITLMKRIFLIDCPGVVYHRTNDSESDAVLKGVVRVEGLEDATQHVQAVLERIKPEYLRRAYKLQAWEDHEDFLAQLARSTGKLLKGGDPDLNTAARIVLYDWQRGKIPFYTLPPGYSELPPGAAAADAAAAAVEQQQQQMFAAAVTEDDAAAEAGARPENAAAAAQALRDAAAAALRKQRHSAIPTKEDYYMPGEERGDGKGGSDEEIEQGSSSEDDSDSEAAEGGSEVESEDEQQQDGDGEPGSEAGSSEDEAAAAAGKHKGQQQRGKKQAAAAAAADDSGDDSDGYGEAGLSWEAVLEAVQGGGEEAAAAAAEPDSKQPAAAADAAEAAAAPAASKRKKGGKKKGALTGMKTLD
uniref:Nuclear/nucleolar GTPase 2 n=1 Tax=Tetradesmus obliquus TaxID=3088 RepID=A0A383VJE8_TETOB|eukprot:jgi/Sobl393_1/8076/SZX65645.1